MTKILPGYARQMIPDFASLGGNQQKDKGSNLSFPQVFKEMVQNTNDLESQAAQIAEKFALGEVTDIHEVMIAAEEAGVALNLVMEIRNKLIEAYQEMMRMPV
jgi:flagellar hook-basal body complex protein FliE